MASYAEIASALDVIPAEDRETWVAIGMAIKSELGEDGFGLWDQWSQRAHNYNARDARDVWKSIKSRDGIRIGTLFKIAKDHGWRPPKRFGSNGDRNQESPKRFGNQQKKPATTGKRIGSSNDTHDFARLILDRSREVVDHPYLSKKKLNPIDSLRSIDASVANQLLGYTLKSSGEPLYGKLLVVPVYKNRLLSTIEFIDEHGRKTALPGEGTKTGAYWASEDLISPPVILLAEGVATAMSGWQSTGFPAVAALSCTNLGNVCKFLRQEFPSSKIIILADVDKITGETDRHAIDAARTHRALLAVPVFKNRRDGDSDFNDLYVAEGAEAVEFCISNAKAQGAFDEPISVIDAFQHEPPQLDFIWNGFLSGTVGALIAPGGTGKSFWALQAAIAVACNEADTIDINPSSSGKVVYFAAEDQRIIIQHRLHSIAAAIPQSLWPRIAQNLHIECIGGIGVDLANAMHAKRILEISMDSRLVILDTLSRVHNLDENSNSDMANLVSIMEYISRETNAAILYLHHVSKLAAFNGSLDMQQAARGASALIDNARWCGFVSRMSEDEAKDATDLDSSLPINRNFFVKFGLSKFNYSLGSLDPIWYRRCIGGYLSPARLKFGSQPSTKENSHGKRTGKNSAWGK